MEFGRVKDVDAVDFSFPTDPPITTQVLSNLKKPKSPTIYVGCAKWGRKDWIGKVYPKGTKEKEFFKKYAENFDCVELNSIFYNLPKDEWIARWVEDSNDNFKFCPKVNSTITHRLWLRNAEDWTQRYINCIDQFGDKRGTAFLQVHDNFNPNRFEDLKNYIENVWPKGYELALEVRNTQWFDDTVVANEMFEMLRENGIGTVITDTAGRRDVLHMKLTNGTAFIRYVGNSLHPSDYQRIDDWVAKMGEWIAQGIHTIYFFMHQHEEFYSPELCHYLIEKMNLDLNLNVKAPTLLNKNGLFD